MPTLSQPDPHAGIESSADRLTLTVAAPAGAGATLDGIDWIVRAAGRRAA